ncbi:hypothetical protein K491DRAFT_710419 [Lophiostoma macrostomum CBS 122681]|uniref:Uncharacterized protein n=1 Tax=Lophiostoma macrostomum CBS 122681 TaxID=1314788 RepID=A0A6A6TQC9_9PLEO|nr:hypothetical protein K491DRAFT_710419 [Lophiostoma macrostomum CBS 122681]
MAQNNPTLVDLLSTRFSPIQENISEYLGAAEILALRQTATGFSDLVESLRDTKYNIKNFLARWFSDTKEFRSLQGKCNAYIVGDCTLDYFARETASCVLGISIEKKYKKAITDYILAQGYDKDEDNDDGVIWFSIETDTEEIVIRMTLQSQSSMFAVLSRSYTTGSFVVITWNKAYCLLPYQTIVLKEIYLLSDMDQGATMELVDFSEQGYKTMSVHFRDRGKHKPLVRLRRVGDRYTWVMKLDTDGVEIPEVPDSVIESCTFRLRVEEEEGPIRERETVAHYETRCKPLFAPVLRYQYVIVKGRQREDPDHVELSETLQSRLSELTKMEILKIPKAQRTADCSRWLRESLSLKWIYDRFVDFPPSWTFYDDEVTKAMDYYWKRSQYKEGTSEEEER